MVYRQVGCRVGRSSCHREAGRTASSKSALNANNNLQLVCTRAQKLTIGKYFKVN